MVVVAQALVALPLVVRGVAPALSSVPPAYLDAAALSGMSSRSIRWRVELPVVRPAIAASVGLALVAALGEFGATVFVARRSAPTVPVAIERLLSRPGQSGMGQAMALSVLLALLCAGVLWVVDRVGAGRAGGGAGYVGI
ncbi:MAG: ABC transporter permease subunit, partial [Microthrixaceae bacterium]